MFGVRARLSVFCHNRPFIFQSFRLVRSEIEHRLKRENKTGADFFLRSRSAVIGDLRCFMHCASDSVSGVITDNSVTVFFPVLLNRVPEIVSMHYHGGQTPPDSDGTPMLSFSNTSTFAPGAAMWMWAMKMFSMFDAISL